MKLPQLDASKTLLGAPEGWFQGRGRTPAGAVSRSWECPSSELLPPGCRLSTGPPSTEPLQSRPSPTLTIPVSRVRAPSISTQPADQSVNAGQPATFFVEADGSPPLAYQWQCNGDDISGASSASYTIESTTVDEDQDTYAVVVSNDAGANAVVSDSATLTVSGRVTDGLQVLYTFDEGEGTMVYDVSGVGSPLDLFIQPASTVAWVGGGGVTVTANSLIASGMAATKLHDSITTSGELSIEAWVCPANVTQDGPARIVTLSQDEYNRNFTLGEGLWGAQPTDLLDIRLRTTTSGANGYPPDLSSPAGSLTATQVHAVYTRDPSGQANVYMNGVSQASATMDGDLSTWDASYKLGLANEFTNDRPWLGTIWLVAVYSRALSADEVNQNFAAGP